MINAMPRIAIAVKDYAAAVDTFRTQFAMPVADFSDRTVPQLGTHVGMCMPVGGSNIELMAPATPEAPLAQALQRFLDRRGEGLYALMLEAADPDAEAELVRARGLDVMELMKGAGGRDLHPRSTHGVLIRIYPDNSVGEHDLGAGAAPSLSGITRATLATDDAEKAADVYAHGLGLAVTGLVEDRDRGVLRAICSPNQGGQIELVSAIDTTKPFAKRIADHVSERGRGLFGLTLSAPNAAAAVALLRDRGITFSSEHPNETTVFGARFTIDPQPPAC